MKTLEQLFAKYLLWGALVILFSFSLLKILSRNGHSDKETKIKIYSLANLIHIEKQCWDQKQ